MACHPEVQAGSTRRKSGSFSCVAPSARSTLNLQYDRIGRMMAAAEWADSLEAHNRPPRPHLRNDSASSAPPAYAVKTPSWTSRGPGQRPNCALAFPATWRSGAAPGGSAARQCTRQLGTSWALPRLFEQGREARTGRHFVLRFVSATHSTCGLRSGRSAIPAE